MVTAVKKTRFRPNFPELCACAVTYGQDGQRRFCACAREPWLAPRGSVESEGGSVESEGSMSAPFEERSGVVPCVTPWGQWYQTLEEVFIEVQVPPGTRAQEIQCSLQSRHVELAVRGQEILKGKLFDSTIADEGTWTLEDRKMVRIVLTKTKRDAANCWTSLLETEYAADPWVQDQMQRKLTLERFQKENPGFDFSGAEISGNYSKGGPDFSSLEK